MRGRFRIRVSVKIKIKIKTRTKIKIKIEIKINSILTSPSTVIATLAKLKIFLGIHRHINVHLDVPPYSCMHERISTWVEGQG